MCAANGCRSRETETNLCGRATEGHAHNDLGACTLDLFIRWGADCGRQLCRRDSRRVTADWRTLERDRPNKRLAGSWICNHGKKEIPTALLREQRRQIVQDHQRFQLRRHGIWSEIVEFPA